jgi:Flp pilus assembly protein TadG
MNILRRIAITSRRRKRRCLSDESGLAAIEFALLFPVLVLLYLGSVEIVEGIMLQRQTSLTATTIANIVTQYSSISASTQLPDIMNASAQIFAPNPSANATIVVSLISIDSTGKATVTWSQSLNGSARTTGSTVTIPSQLDIPNSTLLLSETTYAYTPTIDFINMGTQNLHESILMVPRASSTINLTS